ncbi:MAG: cupin domain-containing protein, partial [Sphingomicrobium sp.]
TIGALLVLAMVAACSRAEAPAPANDAEPAAQPAATSSDTPLAIAASDTTLKWGPCPPIFTAPGCEIAVLNGDPAKPNADVFLRIPGGYVIPPHRHSSAERMILVTGKLRVRYSGSPAATLAEGNYAYGPAGLAHEGQCLGTEPCTLFIAFEGPVDAETVAAI